LQEANGSDHRKEKDMTDQVLIDTIASMQKEIEDLQQEANYVGKYLLKLAHVLPRLTDQAYGMTIDEMVQASMAELLELAIEKPTKPTLTIV
jgi:hypothetical protein